MANAAAAAEGDELAETVSRLVLRVTMQREHAGGSSRHQPHGGGPLTAQELQELSFYCTAQDCAVAAATNNAAESSSTGFASVEGDPLVALIELLDQHVNQAVTVHLIEAAIAVYQAAGGSPSQANAAMDQVR